MNIRNKISQKAGKFQRGAVLLTVLLVVVFLSLILLDIGKNVQYQSTLNRNLLQRDQGYEYLIGMEELAKIYLKKAFDNTKDDNVNLSQPWAKKNIQFPFDGGSMSGVIRDMQSCFNLNSIAMIDTSTNATNNSPRNSNQGPVTFSANNANATTNASQDPDEQNKITIGEQLLTLLIEKSVDNTDVQASAIAAAVRDWIDKDSTPSGPDGAEDSFYQGLQTPYLPPNGPIAHVSELRVIKGVDPMSYAQIRSDLCVLPDSEENKINVNTITFRWCESDVCGA
ncbi:MAG: type II secretion system minor pseudopilin GspK [Enterobacterales bacterium]|nr:type II secretion system minor pseudopilin GspK [Enterobacterales bacterium]